MKPKSADALDVSLDDDAGTAELDDLLKQLDDPADAEEDIAAKDDSDADTSVDDLLAEIRRIREDVQKQFAVSAPTGEDTTQDKSEPPKLDIPEVTDEQLGALAKYKDQLSKLAQAASGEQMQPVLEQINALSENIKRMEQQFQQQAKTTFAQTLRAAIPDIDRLHKQKDFALYLQQEAPFSGGRTLAELLAEAYETQDLARVREIVDGFREKNESRKDVSRRPAVAGRGSAVPSGAPAQDMSSDLDERYTQASQRLTRMYLEKKIDDAQYQQAVAKLRKKYDLVAGAKQDVEFA